MEVVFSGMAYGHVRSHLETRIYLTILIRISIASLWQASCGKRGYLFCKEIGFRGQNWQVF